MGHHFFGAASGGFWSAFISAPFNTGFQSLLMSALPLVVHIALKASGEILSLTKRTEPSAISTYVPFSPLGNVTETNGSMLRVSGMPRTVLPPPAIQGAP